jgi:hypothetical protein
VHGETIVARSPDRKGATGACQGNLKATFKQKPTTLSGLRLSGGVVVGPSCAPPRDPPTQLGDAKRVVHP